MIYLFDVDGTLTYPRRKILDNHKDFMSKFVKSHECYIISGSHRKYTYEQIGDLIYEFTGVFTSSSNEYYIGSDKVFVNDSLLTDEVKSYVNSCIDELTTPFGKFSCNIEDRPGMFNISIIGRDCPFEYREKYYEWDKQSHQRENLVNKLKLKFPHFNFSIGGQISIDCYIYGKEHCLEFLPKNTFIKFYGDKTQKGGNDYPIANAILANHMGEVNQVNGPTELYNLLINED